MLMVERRTVGPRGSGTAQGAGLANTSVDTMAPDFDEKAIVDAAQVANTVAVQTV